MASIAALSSLEVRLGIPEGSLSGVDKARAEAALEDASILVREAAGQAWTDAAGALPAPETAVTVALRAALREYRNPQGFTTEGLGDYSYQLGEGYQSGAYLTDDERAMIRSAVGATSPGLGSVRTPYGYGDRPGPSSSSGLTFGETYP